MAFAPMIERLVDIVLAVQNELKTQVLGEKRPRPVEGEEQQRAAKVPRPTHASTSTAKAGRLSNDFCLARKVGMCFGCGKLYPAAVGTRDRYDKTLHDPVCEKPFIRGVITGEFKAAIVSLLILARVLMRLLELLTGGGLEPNDVLCPSGGNCNTTP
jgi:hypothetical protein